MTRYLVTSSLYSSWYYFMNSGDEAPADAEGEERRASPQEEFLTTLRREKTPPSEGMLKGRKFEEDVVRCMRGLALPPDDEPWNTCCRDTAAKVKGALIQEKVYKPVVIGIYPVLLYGKTDFMRRNRAFDTKFTKSYEIGKYSDSIQHDLYMVCADLPYFSYLPTDGRNLYEEAYCRTPDSEQIMFGRIHEMLLNIMLHKPFADLYTAHWGAKPLERTSHHVQ